MQTTKTFAELEEEHKHLIMCKAKTIKHTSYHKSKLLISNTGYNILKAIKYNDMHYATELAKYLDNQSTALISFSLRNLTKDGFVSKTSRSYHHQEYNITDLGHMIMAIIAEKELLENKQCTV